jgi:hypothetical protein
MRLIIITGSGYIAYSKWQTEDRDETRGGKGLTGGKERSKIKDKRYNIQI